jgi:spermidine/putrescine-binding protein
VNYLKAFGVGDVWVAVGWSTDVIPFAKRSSNVAVIVPKSGTSLWADLWVSFLSFHIFFDSTS